MEGGVLAGLPAQCRAEDKQFRLIIVGDGPERECVEIFCEKNSWCIWVGAKKGVEKAKYLAAADFILNPGMVGLGILDSFVAAKPMITTDCGIHSPEIAYLENGYNGLMVGNNQADFLGAIRRIINDNDFRERLVHGCKDSALIYSVDEMAERFRDGVKECLKS